MGLMFLMADGLKILTGDSSLVGNKLSPREIAAALRSLAAQQGAGL